MPVDTSQIDLVALIERETGLRYIDPRNGSAKACWKGPCPWCAGTNRCGIFMNCDKPHFFCGVNEGNGCGKKGDAIEFIKMWRSLAFSEACQYLEIALENTEYRGSLTRKPREPDKDVAPTPEWQKRGVALCKEAYEFLWSDTEIARQAQAYLQGRGLSVETIQQAKLGYFPGSHIVTKNLDVWGRFDLRSLWGLKDIPKENGSVTKNLFIPRGWVIPWFIKLDTSARWSDLWRIDIRRHNEDIVADVQAGKGEHKYHKVTGSSDGLYNYNVIQESKPLFVVESPIDALVGTQEANTFVWVATGSTSGARRDPNWCEAMRIASPVILAFDADKPGNAAFDYWKKQQSTLGRWVPFAHDINEMKLAGINISDWAQLGLKTVTALNMLAKDSTSSNDVVEKSIPSWFFADALSPIATESQISQSAGEGDQAQFSSIDTLAVRVSWALEGAPTGVTEDVEVLLTMLEDQDQVTPWLEHMRAAWSLRDSAALYMLAEQIDFPGEKFVDRLGLHLEQPTDGDQGEQKTAAQFADQVQALVDSAETWPDGYSLQVMPAGSLNMTPIEQKEPSLSDRLCPHCAAAGRRSRGGVRTINNVVMKIAGGSFHYAWNDARQFWVCSGCLDIQPSMPADATARFEIDESAPEWVGPQIDLDLEPEAIRIAETEKLSLPQARYWARTRRNLARSGYYEQVKRDNVKLQERVAAYRAKWFGEAS